MVHPRFSIMAIFFVGTWRSSVRIFVCVTHIKSESTPSSFYFHFYVWLVPELCPSTRGPPADTAEVHSLTQLRRLRGWPCFLCTCPVALVGEREMRVSRGTSMKHDRTTDQDDVTKEFPKGIRVDWRRAAFYCHLLKSRDSGVRDGGSGNQNASVGSKLSTGTS
jgi:hypothetical protein